MSAARDEVLQERQSASHEVPPPARPRRRGVSSTRIVAVVVVAVACVWLAAVTYGVWWLLTRI